jgi:hypothetical protein
MKNIFIRAFVIALAITGATASAHIKASGHAVVANASAFPVPMCGPRDPNGCGID